MLNISIYNLTVNAVATPWKNHLCFMYLFADGWDKITDVTAHYYTGSSKRFHMVPIPIIETNPSHYLLMNRRDQIADLPFRLICVDCHSPFWNWVFHLWQLRNVLQLWPGRIWVCSLCCVFILVNSSSLRAMFGRLRSYVWAGPLLLDPFVPEFVCSDMRGLQVCINSRLFRLMAEPHVLQQLRWVRGVIEACQAKTLQTLPGCDYSSQSTCATFNGLRCW